MEAVITFAGIVVVIGMIGVVIVYTVFAEKKRTRAVQAIADSLGLELISSATAVPSGAETFPLCQQGHSRRASNVMRGGTDDEQLFVFDYRFTTGSGKHQATHNQTVAFLRSAMLDLPPFDLYPERWYHRVGQSVFGMKDINFAEYPGFSKLYVLKGDEEPVRRIFTEPLVRHLESEKNICAAGADKRLIFFRQGRRVKPEELKAFMRSAYQMYALVRGDASERETA